MIRQKFDKNSFILLEIDNRTKFYVKVCNITIFSLFLDYRNFRFSVITYHARARVCVCCAPTDPNSAMTAGNCQIMKSSVFSSIRMCCLREQIGVTLRHIVAFVTETHINCQRSCSSGRKSATTPLILRRFTIRDFPTLVAIKFICVRLFLRMPPCSTVLKSILSSSQCTYNSLQFSCSKLSVTCVAMKFVVLKLYICQNFIVFRVFFIFTR